MLNREAIFSAIQAQLDADTPAREHFAVLVLRVQGLREYGLRFGYEQGEQAEQNAGDLIAQSLRPMDRVYAAGDSTFAVLLPGMHNRNHALLATARLSKAFEQQLDGGVSPWRGRAIMGLALYPEHGDQPDVLCRHAQMALDEAQRRGEQCAVFQPHATQAEILYEDLRDAIESNRLDVFFQPIHDLHDRRIVAVESLARWTSPQHGNISPASFVPFSERSDLISTLTRWSINATLRHAATLPPAHGLSVAINLSPRVFARPGIVEQLMDALDIWGVPPTSLVAEITETALVSDLELSVQVLRRLRDQGVRISIDDFGTGYASIAYLRRFPATELKIDQSLVSAMRDDQHTARLVGAVINMAHHMDLSTVAEGIEDQPTLDLLASMGCDHGQGFHLGRPRAAAAFIADFSADTALP
jgi:diguanylate cyclase (GGDEF)-like protein